MQCSPCSSTLFIFRADRESAIHATFSATSMEEAMFFESQNSAKVLTTEAIQGAKKFTAGLGRYSFLFMLNLVLTNILRSGKFNVNSASEPQEWMKELEELKKQE